MQIRFGVEKLTDFIDAWVETLKKNLPLFILKKILHFTNHFEISANSLPHPTV